MAIPKENRQQMINMMYLVLTALLALNVSREILIAFQTINKSLENSKKIADTNISTTYNGFALKRAKEPANTDIQKYQSMADQAKNISKDLLEYIAGIKTEIVNKADGPDTEDADGIMAKKDDLEIGNAYMVGEGKGEGYKLKSKVEDAMTKFLALVDPALKDKMKTQLGINTDPNKKGGDWVREQFYQMPAIAVYSMLTKLENDAKNAENQMIAYLYSRIGDAKELEPEEIVLDQFSAQIAAPSAYVLQGEPFKAYVSLAAGSSESSVSVTVNGRSVPVKDGVGEFTVGTGSVGEFPVNGVVSVKNNRTGKVTSYKTPDFKYTVAPPFASVAADKMNVFYIGVDNPVTVSAAGVSPQKLNVSMTGGNINGSGGKYTVRVSQQGKAYVSVSANGKQYSNAEFRVKMIPDPIAEVGGKSGGRMPSAQFKAQNGLIAALKNFDFDARFQVLSYQLFYQPKMADPAIIPNNGPTFTGAAQQAINKAKPGDVFYFEEIRVQGPDGTNRKIPGIAFKID
jgi:gliding motility-associated protein GldM